MRIVPSDVVAHIRQVFPRLGGPPPKMGSTRGYRAQRAGELRAIVELVDSVDPELLPSGKELVKLVAAKEAIVSKLKAWEGRDPNSASDMLSNTVRGYNTDPVLMIREVMESLQDQVIPESVAGLEFVSDDSLRSDLRADLASIEVLMHAGQWKAAMVLCGSVSEALLLCALDGKDAQEVEETAKKPKLRYPSDPTRWHLPDYVAVAKELGVISSECEKAALLAQDYRNLIHPGKEQRTGRKASKAAAHTSFAGLHHIIEELSAESTPATI